MKHLAKAIINLAAFVELSGDDVIDPDSATDARKMIISDLQKCSKDELYALRDTVSEMIAEAQKNDVAEKRIDFYKSFMKNFGLEKIINEKYRLH